MQPISIGISRCLSGDPVRYDGKGKYSSNCCVELKKTFKLLSVCPEVDAGLSIPRPPVELIQFPQTIKALGINDSNIDVTLKLKAFCDEKVPLLNSISGFVLTPHSPSCGLNSVPIKSRDRKLIGLTSGLFVQSLIQAYPYLPMIEEPELSTKQVLQHFKLQVICYYLIKTNKSSSIDRITTECSSALCTVLKSDEIKSNKIRLVNALLDGMTCEQLQKKLHQLTGILND